MNNIRNILKKSELFCTLTEDQIAQAIIPHGQLLTLVKKQQIFRPGQSVDSFCIVLSGKVYVEYSRPDGGRSLQAVLRAGDVLGAELVHGHDRRSSCYAVAASAATVAVFPVELLLNQEILGASCWTELQNQLLSILSREIVRKSCYLAMHSLKGLRDRIAMYLCYLSEIHQSKAFEIKLSRDEMAAILCVNRSCLSHELSLMEQDGMITFWKGQFILHDPECWKSPAEF